MDEYQLDCRVELRLIWMTPPEDTPEKLYRERMQGRLNLKAHEISQQLEQYVTNLTVRPLFDGERVDA